MIKRVQHLKLNDFVVFRGKNCHVKRLETVPGAITGDDSRVTFSDGLWECTVTLSWFEEIETVKT